MARNYYTKLATAKNFNAVIGALLISEAKRATKYLSPGLVINATRIVHGKKIDRRNSRIDIQVKVGRPNHAERQFINKRLLKGRPVPTAVQIKRFPKRG